MPCGFTIRALSLTPAKIMSEEKSSKKVSIWAHILIGAAGLGILMFDVPSMVGRGDTQTVATVGTRDITLRELNEAVSALQSRLPDLSTKTLQEQALLQLVQQALLEEHALAGNFAYPDALLHKAIKDAFGSDEAYQNWLRERGISAASYQESLRRSGTVDAYYQSLAAAAPKDDILFDALLDDMAQTRDYSAIHLPLAPLAASLTPDEATVAAWYEANSDAFMTPETVSVRYVILDRATLAAEADISAADIADKQRKNERRAGTYLIFDDKSAAEAATTALANGEKTFADIRADIQSGAIGGEAGELPMQQHGKGIDPVVDDALFALEKEGDISGILTSENFNAMLLTLTAREAGSGEDTRAQIANEAAAARYSELAEKAFDAALADKPLEQIAGIIGQEIRTADNLTAHSNDADWLGNAKVQAGLFGADAVAVDRVGEPVELEDGRSIFYQIAARKLPEKRPFADVKSEAEQGFRAQEAGKILDERSAALAQAWQSGQDIEALVGEYGGERRQYKGIGMLLPAEGISPETMQALMHQSEAVSRSTAGNGDRIITRLDAVHAGKGSELPQEMIDLLKNQRALSVQQETQQAMAGWLQQSGGVKIYQDRLPQP